jgi:two-component system chemotaxis sensor kinase CheA
VRLHEVSWSSEEERTLFLEEATELLDLLESQALSDHPSVEEMFRAAHTLKGSGGMLGLDLWRDRMHALEDALDAVRRGEKPWSDELREATLQAVDSLRADMTGPTDGEGAGDGKATAWVLRWSAHTLPGVRMFQALQALGEAIGSAVQSDPPAERLPEWNGREGRLLVPAGTDPQVVRAVLSRMEDLEFFAPVEAPQPGEGSPPEGGSSAPRQESRPREQSIRIHAEVLESLLAGLGELLVDHGQLVHRLQGHVDPDVLAVLDHMRRRTLELQDITLRARMLPLEVLFRQYPRSVQDLSRRLGKRIRLVTEGGSTELDRIIMDRLHEPLLHLIRNAADHGIEPAEERKAKGKAEEGTIRLRAYAAQGHIHVLVEDDGRGIDWEALRAKAVREGWMGTEEATRAGPEELSALLFRPGISTAHQVTDLSGRGVGLDVVRSFVEQIHGTVSVESQPGSGTTFHLELPLTLTIMTALVAEAGPWVVGLPIYAVDRIEEAKSAGVNTVLGQAAVVDEGAPLPVLDLAHLLDAAETCTGQHLVRAKDGPHQAALAVDRVVGQQELVLQPVPGLATVAPWLSGVSTLGDGRLVFVVDVRRVVPTTRNVEADREVADGILRPGSNQMELLVFRLGNEADLYGINVYKVREVLADAKVTPVAGQHTWTEGFLRLRGETVPVIAVDRALGVERSSASGVYIVTEFNQTIQAFLVASVDRMVRVGWEAVEPVPHMLDVASGSRRYTGLVDHPELGPIKLIDFEQILADIVPPSFPQMDSEPRAQGMHVWLADDSRVAREQVLKALQPLGVEVRVFSDGQAVWDAIEAGEDMPQLFLLDVEMPRLDGYTLALRLKSHPSTRHIPVVLHTSLSGRWHAQRAQDVDADAIVTKFDATTLARTVGAFLSPLTAALPEAVAVEGR